MDQRLLDKLSPYFLFSLDDWGKLRADMPLPLNEAELEGLLGLNENVSMQEVTDVYLPLSRLLSFYVAGMQRLFADVQNFFGSPASDEKLPYIIGIAGSVAVGKSTTARILRTLLARWPSHPTVDLVTTDGFLLPNAILEREGLMERKGFPESYDVDALLHFLTRIKAGERRVSAPVYSHFSYDVLADRSITVDRPDILIIEGLNVLAPGPLPPDGTAVPFVSDFFDFSIYLDADETIIERWYIERFLRLRKTAFRDPASYFHRYSKINEDEAERIGRDIWRRINLVNLRENVLPTRARSDLILTKDADHAIGSVALRKL